MAGVNQSTVSDQRGGLFESLRTDAEVVALDVINAGKPLGHISVEVFDAAADDNGQQVVATTRPSRRSTRSTDWPTPCCSRDERT